MAQKNKNKKPGGGGDTGGAGGGSGGLGITKADCEKVKQTSQSRFGGLILEMIISTAGALVGITVQGVYSYHPVHHPTFCTFPLQQCANLS